MLPLDLERRNRLMTVLLRAALVIGVLSYFALLRAGRIRPPRRDGSPTRCPAQAALPAALDAVPAETPRAGGARRPGPRPDGGTEPPRRGADGLNRHP